MKFVNLILLISITIIVNLTLAEARILLNQLCGKNQTLETWIPPSEFIKKFPYYLSGFDHENRPIWVVELGKWDMRTTIEAGGKEREDLKTHVEQFFYRLSQAGKNYRNGDEPATDDIACIMDLENFSLFQLASGPTVQFFLNRFSALQQIQETLAYAFFVNVNSIAQTLINLAKPMLGTAMERIEVHGTQKQRWIPRLLRRFPKNQIGPWYGGDKDFAPRHIYG